MKKSVARFCKISAFSTALSGVCALSLLGLMLGILGTSTGRFVFSAYGDVIFFPSLGMFLTLFVYGLLALKRNYITYLVSVASLAVVFYFVETIPHILLLLPGIAIGLATTRFCTIPEAKKERKWAHER